MLKHIRRFRPERIIILMGVLTLMGYMVEAEGTAEILNLSGITTFAAYQTNSGKLVSDPTMNQCAVEGVLTLVSETSAKLVTTERCTINEKLTFVREIDWGNVAIGADGRVKLRAPENVTTWNDVGGKREDIQTIHFAPSVQEHTGCRPFGSFPEYEGGFDGENLYFSSHFHDICDGGNLWADMLGVSAEMGPLAVTFGFAMKVKQ